MCAEQKANRRDVKLFWKENLSLFSLEVLLFPFSTFFPLSPETNVEAADLSLSSPTVVLQQALSFLSFFLSSRTSLSLFSSPEFFPLSIADPIL